MLLKCKCACCGEDLYVDVEVTEKIRIEEGVIQTEIKELKTIEVYSQQYIIDYIKACIAGTENLNNNIENIIQHISETFMIDISQISILVGSILETIDNGKYTPEIE